MPLPWKSIDKRYLRGLLTPMELVTPSGARPVWTMCTTVRKNKLKNQRCTQRCDNKQVFYRLVDFESQASRINARCINSVILHRKKGLPNSWLGHKLMQIGQLCQREGRSEGPGNGANERAQTSRSSASTTDCGQVVAEEHIIFGRQQVATNLIGPIVTYPIFSGQGILHSSSVAPMTGSDHYLQQRSSPQHQISKNANHQDSSDRASLDGGNVTAQSGQVLTTLVNVTSSDQQSLDGGLSGKDEQYEAIDDDMYHEESPKVQAKIEPMTVISSVSSEDEEEEEKRQTDSIAVVDLSPLATYNDSGEVNELADEGFLNSKMKPSMMDDHSTSNLDTKSPPADQIVASDLPATISYKSDYFSTDDALQGTPTMEDASNHGYYDDELVDDFQRRQYLEEQEDDVEAHSDSGLQNIQADECMPARGELSGHGSVNTAHSWNHVSPCELWGVCRSLDLLFGSCEMPKRLIYSFQFFKDELRMLAPIWEGKTEAVRRYTCLYCDGEFACPKERRLHVATVHCAPNADTKPGDLLGTNNQPRAVMCIKCGLQLESLKDLRVIVTKLFLHEIGSSRFSRALFHLSCPSFAEPRENGAQKSDTSVLRVPGGVQIPRGVHRAHHQSSPPRMSDMWQNVQVQVESCQSRQDSLVSEASRLHFVPEDVHNESEAQGAYERTYGLRSHPVQYVRQEIQK
ncbi:unnamed protein product, partial [Nesidiocoris tenuis]